MILLNIHNIPFDIIPISILKQEQKTNMELRAANPNCLIPTLKDGAFSLYESHAILRYICNTQPVADNWYPKDPKTRALVDQYMDWHHLAIRNQATPWFLQQYVFGISPSDPSIVAFKEKLVTSLTMLDIHTLKNNKFIAGNEISIADIQCLCELVQFWGVGKVIYEGFPNIEKWVKECIALLNPYFDKHHEILRKMKESGQLGSDPGPIKPPDA